MKLTQVDKKELAKTKALVKRTANQLPQVGVPIHKVRYPKQRGLDLEQVSQIEQSYDQLDGEWLDWLGVARKYEGKVPAQDRYDVRHDILIELARARARDCEPIPILRAYRIASFMIADYWREVLKREVKVCVYNGVATEPKCANCRHKPKVNRCAYLASRPIQSLDQPTADHEGYQCRLLDTIADDNAIEAIDLDAKLDASQWLLGCKVRLVEIATKRKDGIPLTKYEQLYLCRFWKRHQKRLIE